MSQGSSRRDRGALSLAAAPEGHQREFFFSSCFVSREICSSRVD